MYQLRDFKPYSKYHFEKMEYSKNNNRYFFVQNGKIFFGGGFETKILKIYFLF
jgi:hypothetical protein